MPEPSGPAGWSGTRGPPKGAEKAPRLRVSPSYVSEVAPYTLRDSFDGGFSTSRLKIRSFVGDRFPDRVFAFDEFGPLGIRPTAGSGWAEQGRPDRLPATYHRTHGVRYFHGCYSVGDDRMWGVNRRKKGAVNTLAALKSIRAARPDGAPIYVILDNLSAHKSADIRRWASRRSWGKSCGSNAAELMVRSLERATDNTRPWDLRKRGQALRACSVTRAQGRSERTPVGGGAFRGDESSGGGAGRTVRVNQDGKRRPWG